MVKSLPAALALLGLGACVSGPTVLVTAPAREPVSNLDAMAPGQTELSASLGVSLYADDKAVAVYPLDLPTLGSPWTLAAAHSVGPVELRGAYNRSLLWDQGKVGVGLRLPSLGPWDFVVDGGYAFGGYAGSYSVGEDDDAREVPYAYRMHAPYGRARVVRSVGDTLSVVGALRVAHAWTQPIEGVSAQNMEQQTFPELSLGLVHSAPKTCLQVGLGGHYVPVEQVHSVQLQGALSCAFDVGSWRR